MKNDLVLIQVLPNNIIIPLMTSAQGETDAAATMDLYPNAGYHFLYAKMELHPLEDWELHEFGAESDG